MPLPLNLAMTQGEIHAAAHLSPHIAWMACHFSPEGDDLIDLPAQLPEGVLLILDDSIPCRGHSAALAAEILGEVVSHFRCCGLLLDFQRPENAQAAGIAKHLAATLPCPIAVTPHYAKDLPCAVFLPPAPLHIPLATYLRPWAGKEIWLEAALCLETLTVTKDGTSFSPVFMSEGHSGGFFDENLSCRYRTKIRNDRITFTLFDTQDTLKYKLEQASTLGVTRAVGLYQELGNDYV